MDFRSRDRYRHAVEELAEPTGDAQVRVALKSVERARRVAEAHARRAEAHVGYYLIGDGRRQFERSVDWEPEPGAADPTRCSSATRRRCYLGTIGVGTRRCSSRVALAYAHAHGWRAADCWHRSRC